MTSRGKQPRIVLFTGEFHRSNSVCLKIRDVNEASWAHKAKAEVEARKSEAKDKAEAYKFC